MGILLVTAAALGIAGAAVFALGDRSMLVPPPEAEVETFVRQLATGRFERALPHLSRRAAGRTSRDSLRARFLALEARIGKVRDVKGQLLTQARDTAYAEAVLDAEGASGLPLAFRLVREDGVWVVDDLGELALPLPVHPPRRTAPPPPSHDVTPPGAGPRDSAPGS